MDQKQVFIKIVRKRAIFIRQSPENDQTKHFFHKQKMLGTCDFYNRFSISGPFDLSEWVPDGPEPLGAEDGLRAQQEGSI